MSRHGKKVGEARTQWRRKDWRKCGLGGRWGGPSMASDIPTDHDILLTSLSSF